MIGRQIHFETGFTQDRPRAVAKRPSRPAPITVGLLRLSVIFACVAFWAVVFHSAADFAKHSMSSAQLSASAPALGR